MISGTGSPATFRTRRRVEFVDTDMAGIVHFSNFFRYMEAAEVDFLAARGLAVKLEWEGRTISFPRVAASCDYFKPARFPDELEIVVALERIGRKSLTYGFEIFRGELLLARGRTSCVCCRFLDNQDLESMDIPPKLRSLLVP